MYGYGGIYIYIYVSLSIYIHLSIYICIFIYVYICINPVPYNILGCMFLDALHFPWCDFGLHLGVLGSIWSPVGSIWWPLGSMPLLLGIHSDVLGMPLRFSRPFGGSLDCPSGLPIPGQWLSSPQPVDKSWRPGTQRAFTTIPRIPAKCDLAGSSPPPFLPLEARMTVVKHIPSNK